MKSRVLLPACITSVGIVAISLVFCRKDDEVEVSGTPAAAIRTPAQASPMAGRQAPDGRTRVEKKTGAQETETAKVLTPEEEEKQAAGKAFTMFKWMTAFALDNGGFYPPDTSALMSKDLGFPINEAGEWLRHVIEYRGRDLANSDEGRLLLMRYRIGKRTDKEVRLYISGKAEVVPSTDPIPEDISPATETPR